MTGSSSRRVIGLEAALWSTMKSEGARNGSADSVGGGWQNSPRVVAVQLGIGLSLDGCAEVVRRYSCARSCRPADRKGHLTGGAS